MYERGNARVRVLHTSPDAPAVDVYVDGAPAIMSLSFGEISDYAELPAGRHNVMVFPAGMGGMGNAVINTDLSLNAGQDYTVAAVDQLSNIHAMVINDTTAAPGPNMVKARVFHASPDAPAVDVGVPGGPTLFQGISFMEITPFAEIAAGTVSLEIRPSGSMQAVLVIPDVTLEGGSIYTFVALGLLEGMPGFQVMPIVDRVPMRAPM